MVYKVIDLMTESSPEGLNFVYVESDENAGKWSFTKRKNWWRFLWI